jgi:hypothetical protein
MTGDDGARRCCTATSRSHGLPGSMEPSAAFTPQASKSDERPTLSREGHATAIPPRRVHRSPPVSIFNRRPLPTLDPHRQIQAVPCIPGPSNQAVPEQILNAPLRLSSQLSHSSLRSNHSALSGSSIKHDMMVKWLYEQQLRISYASGAYENMEGVVLKKSRGSFTCFPPQLAAFPSGLFSMVVEMNVRVRINRKFQTKFSGISANVGYSVP